MLKDPEFITYMNAQIDLFLETNVPPMQLYGMPLRHLWGDIFCPTAHGNQEKGDNNWQLDEEIRILEQKHSETKKMDILNSLTVKQIQYNNLCKTKVKEL